MDISIVIVSFNTRDLLRDCLESIAASKKNYKTEIFVIDNNSDDNSAEMVEKFFPKIHLIKNRKNLGFSKANNIAIKKAKGKYVLVLNPDTILLPATITKMIDFMEKNPNVGVSTCKVELLDGRLDKDCRRHFPSPWRAFCHFSKLSIIFSKSKIFDQYYMGYLDQNQQHEVDSCVGAFMFIRRSALKNVGLFDEDYFFYGEDLDLCWRIKKAGYKIYYTPITKIIHYKGAASGIKASSKKYSKATTESKKLVLVESIRAMRIFYRKHYANSYPIVLNWSVLFALLILEKIRLLKP